MDTGALIVIFLSSFANLVGLFRIIAALNHSAEGFSATLPQDLVTHTETVLLPRAKPRLPRTAHSRSQI
jgi:hypothetical protein